MKFEFDPTKSEANKVKHGIDFAEAQALWLDEGVVEADAVFRDEPRSAVIAELGGKLWFAVFTRRGERVRIITVRRARKNEERAYGRP